MILESANLLLRDRVSALATDVVVAGDVDARPDHFWKVSVNGIESFRVGCIHLLVTFATYWRKMLTLNFYNCDNLKIYLSKRE